VAEQPPVGLVASVFSSLQVKGLGLISFLVFRRERERQIQGNKLLLPVPLRIQGKNKPYITFQNGTVLASSLFFFFFF
jgi:hypothetical protein